MNISDLIINVYQKFGTITIEEDINQLQHAEQCAKFALDCNSSNDLIIAALLHDIGQLPPNEFGLNINTISDKYGSNNHEYIGTLILKHLGFNENIIDLVQNHVDAKRYLTYKNKKYKLSNASQQTLIQQGGIMTESEAKEFEQKHNFKDIIKLRYWDDKAKLQNYPVPDISNYKNFIVESLNSNASFESVLLK